MWLMSCSVKWNLHLNKNYMQKLHFTFTFFGIIYNQPTINYKYRFFQNITGTYRN